jgi:hypothetical protein
MLDILLYLDESAVLACVPRFPGWEEVLRHADATGTNLKDAARKLTGAWFGVEMVRRVTRHMIDHGTPPHPELAEMVATVVTAAYAADGA